MLTNGRVKGSSRSALVLYGTETGNSQDIAYEISQLLERLHFITISRDLDATPLSDLLHHDLVVIAISTTGQGDFPSNARKFWLSLLRKKLSASSLQNVCYAIVGLCDSSYPKFNLAGRKLQKRLQQLGAKSIIEPCEADEQDEEGTEGAFLAWLPQFQEQLLDHFPLPEGQIPIPASQSLPSPWVLVEAAESNCHVTEVDQHSNSSYMAVLPTGSSFLVRLEQNERVTPIEHWQDVRQLRLSTDEPVEYMPGDALAIRPLNLPQEVDQLIDLLGWKNVADKPLKLRATSKVPQDPKSLDPELAKQRAFTLRDLLTKYLDINAIPRRSFFAKIAYLTHDEMQKERALEFADPQYLDEYFDYATRPRRSILEVLQEFHTVKIPWQEAINIFPVMRPRQFSVASGGALKKGGRSFELLVAIVRYRTVIKRIREGVCTKYLARLPVGAELRVTVHTEGRFHKSSADLRRPHLLIGGGTGIAPLRSIVHEKIEHAGPGFKSVLIFGCRNATSDYFFEKEWSSLSSGGSNSLRVITAFSRDQSNKVYVQNRIRENAKLVRDMLLDPTSLTVVCGSSGAMPKAVRQALVDVLQDAGTQCTLAEAEETVAMLERQGRYKQETW